MDIIKIILICLGAVLALIVLLLLIALIRTLLMPSHKATYKPDPDPEREKKYAETLREMIRCETVSYEGDGGTFSHMAQLSRI